MPRNKEFDYDGKLLEARNLFWKRGYNATSMSELVDAMKINRSSIYLTYGNKHELFLKSLGDYMRNKDNQYHLAAGKSDEPLQAIRNIVYSVYESALEESNCLFTNTVFELGNVDKEVGKLLKNQALNAVGLFEKLLLEAKAEGTLKSDKEPRALACFLVAGLSSIYTSQILFSDSQLTKQTADLLIDSVI